MNPTGRIACAAILFLGLTGERCALAQSTPSLTGAVGTQQETASPAQVTVPLTGTLFFSQEQRERMDRARKYSAIPVDVEPTEHAVPVLNGFVKRSDGYSAIWVDGRPRYRVQSDGVLRLQPTDVGGSAAHVSVISQSAPLPALIANPSRIKKTPSKRTTPKRAAKKR